MSSEGILTEKEIHQVFDKTIEERKNDTTVQLTNEVGRLIERLATYSQKYDMYQKVIDTMPSPQIKEQYLDLIAAILLCMAIFSVEILAVVKLLKDRDEFKPGLSKHLHDLYGEFADILPGIEKLIPTDEKIPQTNQNVNRRQRATNRKK